MSDDLTEILNRPRSPFGALPAGDDRAPHRQLDVGRRAGNHQPEAITFLERLEGTTDEITAAIAEIHDFLTGITRPAQHRVVRLTAQATNRVDQTSKTWPSFGVYNPNSFNVYAGVGGEIATNQGGAFPVPAWGSVVLPIAVQDVELGAAAADLAAGDAVIHLFRFASVQAFQFGAWK